MAWHHELTFNNRRLLFPSDIIATNSLWMLHWHRIALSLQSAGGHPWHCCKWHRNSQMFKWMWHGLLFMVWTLLSTDGTNWFSEHELPVTVWALETYAWLHLQRVKLPRVSVHPERSVLLSGHRGGWLSYQVREVFWLCCFVENKLHF